MAYKIAKIGKRLGTVYGETEKEALANAQKELMALMALQRTTAPSRDSGALAQGARLRRGALRRVGIRRRSFDAKIRRIANRLRSSP